METATQVGLFYAAYEIGTGAIGAPSVTVHLLVNTPQRVITGTGNLTQSINPPINRDLDMNGFYTYATVMPNNTHILVTLYGTTKAQYAVMPSLNLHMALESDWKSGVASFNYQDENGNWQSVENAPVKQITPATL